VRARRLWHALLRRPRLPAGLLAWTALVLVGLLVRRAVFPDEAPTLLAVEAALIVSALLALGLAALVVVHFYLSVRDIRDQIFEGDYQEAYEVARRHAGVVLGIHFERALRRLLQFDRRRAEKVAATTRLVGRLMREAPMLMLLADRDADQVRFSVALCELFEINDNRFSIDSLLRQPDNEDFARIWQAVTEGGQSSAEATLTLHLPVRQVARALHVRLLAVQNDEGQIAYVLGFARPPDAEAEAEEPPADVVPPA